MQFWWYFHAWHLSKTELMWCGLWWPSQSVDVLSERNCSYIQLTQLAYSLVLDAIRVPYKKVIIQQGGTTQGLSLVVKGEVLISQVAQSTKKRLDMGIIGPTGCFGEFSIVGKVRCDFFSQFFSSLYHWHAAVCASAQHIFWTTVQPWNVRAVVEVGRQQESGHYRWYAKFVLATMWRMRWSQSPGDYLASRCRYSSTQFLNSPKKDRDCFVWFLNSWGWTV